jgi:HKD family nuclease
MNYRKIIPSKKLRTTILQLLSFLNDKTMVKMQYYIATGKKLNLKEPTTFNEKLQWYKVYYRIH